jgi:6-phosphofructokinase 1
MDIVARYLEKRAKNKKPYSIVVVAEGIAKPKGTSAASFVAQSIKEKTGLETRETILGYVQRGGSPTPMDRILATRYGAHAVELIAEGKFGVMVCKDGETVSSVPLEQVGGKLKLVPFDHPIVKKSRKMGICFGDKKV